MLFRGLLLSFLLLNSLSVGAALPLTPFERSTTYTLPNSTEVSAYLHQLTQQSSQASVLSLGHSAGGRPIDALLLSHDAAFLKNGQPEIHRPTVMLIGSQHGNEPSGTEAVQILVRQVLDGDQQHLLDKMNFIAIVLANPDGRDLNRRLNAKDENPNIDFIATAASETQIYIDALQRFQPDVVYDLHETGRVKYPLTYKEGYLSTINAQFEVGDNPNIDSGLRRYADNVFLPKLLKQVSTQGIPATRYDGEIITLSQAVTRGAMNLSNFRNYASLMGSLTVVAESLLDEPGTYATPNNIKERVRRQYVALTQFLMLVEHDAQKIQQLSRHARQDWRNKTDLQIALEFGFAPNPQTPQINVALVEKKSGKRVIKPFPYTDKIVVTETETLPAGFVIRAEQARYKTLLDHHHIQYRVVAKAEKVRLEQQRISALTVSEVQRPGVRDWLDVGVQEKELTTELKPGDLVVTTHQPLGRLAAIILDPRSDNTIYQEDAWRGLLLQNPLPVAVLLSH
nr:M14 family zinc carboxypeptidase [uncultured Tolumonas sp.]